MFLTFIPLWSQMFLDAVQQYYFADCLICSSVIKPPPVLVSCYFQYLWCQLMIFALFMFYIQAAQQVSAGVCCFIQLATTLNPLTSEINGTNKCKLRSEWFWQRSTCDGYNWVTSSKQQVWWKCSQCAAVSIFQKSAAEAVTGSRTPKAQWCVWGRKAGSCPHADYTHCLQWACEHHWAMKEAGLMNHILFYTPSWVSIVHEGEETAAGLTTVYGKRQHLRGSTMLCWCLYECSATRSPTISWSAFPHSSDLTN